MVIIEGAESPLDLPERLSLPRNRGPSNFPSFLLLGKKLIVITIKKKKKSHVKNVFETLKVIFVT